MNLRFYNWSNVRVINNKFVIFVKNVVTLFKVKFLFTLSPFYNAFATTIHKPCMYLFCTSLCMNIFWHAVQSKCYIDFLSAKRILIVKIYLMNKLMTIYIEKKKDRRYLDLQTDGKVGKKKEELSIHKWDNHSSIDKLIQQNWIK